MLSAHNAAGEKHRTRPHYLKGTVFCGQCGSRLCISYNRGRHGTEYDYFFCIGRQKGRTTCQQRHLRIHLVEEAVERFYERICLQASEVEDLRAQVALEVNQAAAEAKFEVTRQEKRLAALKAERSKLLKAHYADAIPLSLMKEEMARIEQQTREAEKSMAAARQPFERLVRQLDDLQILIERVDRLYLEGDDLSRRQTNQALFQKLFITEDGVSGAEPSDLLAGILTMPQDQPESTLSEEIDVAIQRRATEASERKNPGAFRPRGSNMSSVVDRKGFEPLTPCASCRCSNQLS